MRFQNQNHVKLIDYISHDAYLHPSRSSRAAGLHGLDVTRPVPPHHEPPTDCIAHNLSTHRDVGRSDAPLNI